MRVKISWPYLEWNTFWVCLNGRLCYPVSKISLIHINRSISYRKFRKAHSCRNHINKWVNWKGLRWRTAWLNYWMHGEVFLASNRTHCLSLWSNLLPSCIYMNIYTPHDEILRVFPVRMESLNKKWSKCGFLSQTAQRYPWYYLTPNREVWIEKRDNSVAVYPHFAL